MYSVKSLFKGTAYSIAVLYRDADCEVLDFIGGLIAADKAQLTFLIDRIRDHGPPQNQEKFRNEGEGVYALKTKNVRVYGFFDGPRIFTLACGFMKNTGGRKVERRFHERTLEMKTALFKERGAQ